MNHSVYPPAGGEPLTYAQFLAANPAVGTLKIQAARARRALPTAGVEITVVRQCRDERVLFFQGLTDEDGLIEAIPLPAPPRALSQQAGSGRRGALYDVFAAHPDFAPVQLQAEIFEGITAILPVTLQLPREVTP